MKALTDLGWMSRSILHGSGWGCALRIEAHFDESGTGARELTIAGYIFEADRMDQFASEWNALLSKYNLPFLHMKDFAPGNPPFDKPPLDDKIARIRLQMQFMSIIRRYAINGIVCNIRNNKKKPESSYLEAVKGSIKLVLDWADKTTFDGQIGYFFEAGATGQGLVDGHFHKMANEPASSARHRYAGHAFLPKQSNPGVQAADFLAWQYHNFTKKRAEQSRPRLDLRSLLRHPHHISDDCGAPPRDSRLQSIKDSKKRIEMVYYLPRTTQNPDDTVLVLTADNTLLTGHKSHIILACPSCFRAICENVSVSEFLGRFTTENRFVIVCWCGETSYIPKAMGPMIKG